MKKILGIILFAIILAGAASAQDVIIKKNGDEIPAKVLEVGTVEIKYKKPESDGPVYTIPKSDIFMIKYADGTKDIFNDVSEPKKEKQRAAKTLKSYVTVGIGLGIPVGKFSHTSGSESGFAMPGLDFNLSYTLPLLPNLGASIKIGRHANPINEGRLKNQVSSDYTAPGWNAYFNDIPPITRTYYMAGLSVLLPGEKIQLDIRALAGMASANYPGYTFTASNASYGLWYELNYSSATSSAFVFSGGLGALYSFNDKFSAMINLDFISSQHEFNHTGTSALVGGWFRSDEEFSGTVNRPISTFSVTAGIGYTIGK